MSQKRFSSSDSRDDSNNRDPPKVSEKESPPRAPDSSSGGFDFGFQSLSALFQQPSRGRYSRPKEREEGITISEPAPESEQPEFTDPSPTRSETTEVACPHPRISEGAETHPEAENAAFPSPAAVEEISPFVLHPTASAEHAAPTNNREKQKDFKARGVWNILRSFPRDKPTARNKLNDIRSSAGEEQDASLKKFGQTPPLRMNRAARRRAAMQDFATRRSQQRTSPNPFTQGSTRKTQAISQRHSRPPFGESQTPRRQGPEKPWGVRFIDPKHKQASEHAWRSIFFGQQQNEVADPRSSTIDSERSSAETPAGSTEGTPPPPAGQQLTHVSASGEARMVDVGAKPATKRVAIASARLSFSKDETPQLIRENGMKKGDVLGVSRIAGIMAAKRTSDLIPLCHPISLTKVDVKVDLVDEARIKSVGVLAQVECTGPTGVEMEAITAASVAALTAYDMCKSVDDHMSLRNARVQYKSGGRRGVFCHKDWSNKLDDSFFAERELEVPPGPGFERFARFKTAKSKVQ